MPEVKHILTFIVFGFCLLRISAISNADQNIQNTITEEERRGASVDNDKNKKGEPEKGTRGAYSSATHKHQHYYYPGEHDSQVSSTGHALLGGLGSLGGSGSIGGIGHSGSGYYSGHSGSSTGGSHYHGSSGYASGSGSGTGYSGYGGYSGHGSQGGYSNSKPYGGHGGNGIYVGGHDGQHGAVALKGLLIPLAGIALLGAAAALSTNPILLQLGVVNGRKRRSVSEEYSKYYPLNPYVKPNGS